ncbi:HlyC/CorC family transporter [Candidatus Acetothermia bacterium]|nr:HlyC/CorC family transporter [Candidatus Acetothermia bacterium]
MDFSWSIPLLIVLTFCSFFFSASEMAIASVGKVRLKVMMREHPRRQRALQILFDDPTRLITSLAIANNFVNLLASSIATLLTWKLAGNRLSLGETALIATGIITLYLLLFGEITPKRIGKNNAERFTIAFITLIYGLSVLLKPLTFTFQWASSVLLRLLPSRFRTPEPVYVSEDAIKMLLDVGEERGLIQEGESEMIRRIFAFDDLVAKQVMIPRKDVISIEVNTPLAEVKDIIAREGHSRYPVYEKNRDNIVGILHGKDMLRFGFSERQKLEDLRRKFQEELPAKMKVAPDEHELEKLKKEREQCEREIRRLRQFLSDAKLRDILRAASYTPMTKPINELLREFQKQRKHMAIVVDEYGSMVGIVTLEDIVEEIVGDIRDEYDEPEERIKKLSEHLYLVDGVTAVDELNQRLGLNMPLAEGVTVSGLLLHRLEDIPKAGEWINVDGARLTVEEATEKEIRKVRIEILSRADE